MENKDENEDEMKEGMYIDAMNQLQKKFNENEIIIKRLKEANDDMYKELISVYGVIRLIDNYLDPNEVSFEIKNLIDFLRGHLSELTMKHTQVQVDVISVVREIDLTDEE